MSESIDRPVRYEGSTLRRFGPKSADHPSCGEECPACHQPMAEGEYTTLVTLGPGEDPEERKKARVGRPYNAVALEVHWDCGPGMDTAPW